MVTFKFWVYTSISEGHWMTIKLTRAQAEEKMMSGFYSCGHIVEEVGNEQ